MVDYPTHPTGANSSPASGRGRLFRITGWFRRGELEEVAREEAAEIAASDPLAGPVTTDVVIEEGSLTRADHQRLSLDSGDIPRIGSERSAVPPGLRRSGGVRPARSNHALRNEIIAGCVLGAIPILGALYLLFRG